MLNDFDFVKLVHVRRTNNVTARIVSNLSLSLEGRRVRFVNFPKKVSDAVLADLT